MTKSFVSNYNRQIKTNSNYIWFILLFIAVAGIVGAFVSIIWKRTEPNVIVVSQPPAAGIPFSVPTRCWGGNCGNRGIDMNLGIRPTGDIFNDPYIPPVKNEIVQTPTDVMYQSYIQMGILTAVSSSTSGGSPLILPLMGRKHINGRQKYNYYTISNTGALNTKLPIRVKGRLCSSEYGCDELFSGDIVFVEGYDTEFKINMYENNQFAFSNQII